MFKKNCQDSAKKKKCFPRRKKLFTFDSSWCKDVQESGTTSLQSSLTFTAGRQLDGDRSLVFSLVGHFCSAPKLCDSWETCQTWMFPARSNQFYNQPLLSWSCISHTWLLRRAVVEDRRFFSCSQSEGKEIKFTSSSSYLAAKAI